MEVTFAGCYGRKLYAALFLFVVGSLISCPLFGKRLLVQNEKLSEIVPATITRSNCTNDINKTTLKEENATKTSALTFDACKIFCEGPLLAAAQNAMIFNDSKTFVDLHLKQSPDDILTAFDKVENPEDPAIMHEFVDKYFDGPGTEFTEWVPEDWKPKPAFLSKIKSQDLQSWAEDLNNLWKKLGRKIKIDVYNNQDRYSLIYLERPFIIPGGRFREFYYWDSFWIMKGLLVCEMTETVRGMLLNFAYLVDKLGFIPNGNRIYYTNRSQPPFFIPSVYSYLQATDDFEFVRSILPILEKEYIFWITNRTVEVKKPGQKEAFLLNQYKVTTDRPRPESYRQDYNQCTNCTEEEASKMYSNLAAGAESGWDFSSRWLKQKDDDLRFIRTKQIVPVDLNSVLCLNEKILSELFERAGNKTKAQYYLDAHHRRRLAMQDIFWVDKVGVWLDYDLESGQNHDEFYPSNVMPMWADCYPHDNDDVDRKVLEYLTELRVFKYPGGIPTSLKNTDQQWDYPNSWAPLQDIIIQALASSNDKEAGDFAFQLAQTWTFTNLKAYKEKGIMYEKYDAERQGVPGHGGEYQNQVGFGWTNGVMLKLLEQYGDKLVANTSAQS